MALEALTARANVGAGTDQLAVINTAGGKAGAVALVDEGGVLIDAANPLHVVLPAGAATETTLAALNAKLPSPGQALMAASQPVVIASNQSAISVVEPALMLTGAAAQTAVVNNILESVAGATGTDVTNYRSMSVQVVSTGTGGTFVFEQSNDNVNWVALPVFNAALTTGVPIAATITASASSIIYTVPIRCHFVRLRIATTITGGSIRAFTRLSTEPWTPSVTTVAQPTAGSLNVTATAGGGTVSPLTVAGASAEASSAKTATGNSASALTNASGRNAYFFVNITAATGTTPTLVVRVQIQDPVSTSWIDLPGAATSSLTTTGLTLLSVTNLPRTYRLAWTITGTTPSFTFSVGIAPVI